MAQMTKSFAENLLKRVQEGKHINTTCWEEEQLIRGWLYWHEHVYEPRMKAFIAAHPVVEGSANSEAMQGGAFSPQSGSPK